MKAAHESDLPVTVLAVINRARRYAEGRAVQLEVRMKRDMGCILKLAEIKMAN